MDPNQDPNQDSNQDPNQDSNQDTIPTPEKQIKIFCGQEYIIPLSVAQTSTLLKNIIVDCQEGNIDSLPIPILEQHVNPEIIPKIIKYMEYIVNSPVLSDTQKSELYFTEFEEEYFHNMTNEQLFMLTRACNYLDIPQLLDVCSSRIAQMIMESQNPKEIREAFRIRQDMDE